MRARWRGPGTVITLIVVLLHQPNKGKGRLGLLWHEFKAGDTDIPTNGKNTSR